MLQRRQAWPLLLVVLALLVVIAGSSSSLNDDDSTTNTCGGPNQQSCSSHTGGTKSTTKRDEEQDDLDRARQWKTFLAFLYQTVDEHAASLKGQPNLQDQERLIMQTWLQYLDMDPSLYQSSLLLQTNWLYDLYHRTRQLAPSIFFKLWDERAPPSLDEINLLLEMDTGEALQEAQYVNDETGQVEIDQDVLMGTLFEPFRQRGFTYSGLTTTFTRVLLGPLKSVGYAIPSPQNVQTLAQYAPLVEVGAGTGYWSAVANATTKVDVVAYDAHPPQPRGAYFDHTYFPVQQGDCKSLFHQNSKAEKDKTTQDADLASRTLLMIWPNNPDNVDNAEEFHSPQLPPIWDVDCLEAYVQAGGSTVILVAERETNIRILPRTYDNQPTQGDSGLCASRTFQTVLQSEFQLVEEHDIPTWYYADDLTVWKKKTANPKHTTSTNNDEL